MDTTRLAPSPTGALHLGNARTFLINWLLARQNGWRIVLRIEDLDGPRIKRGADAQAIDDLRWLGIDWDEGPVYQSQRRSTYAAALGRLIDRGDAYYCVCTRRDVESALSAPHAEDGSAIYPGTCREKHIAPGAAPACVRFRSSAEVVNFEDHFAGPQSFDIARQIGDFVIGKSDGTAAYQLAVVVDDAEAKVTQVVRGDDLLDSAARQILLYRQLQLGAPPSYWHLPLAVGPDGKRLAKRHGDTRLSYYRAKGVTPGRIRALLARWSEIECADEISIDELLRRFAIERLSHDPIIMRPQDEQLLLRA